ncbi:MAG: SET domain-containing protein-lysine N-methyltransferase [Sphingomonadales bacterium]
MTAPTPTRYKVVADHGFAETRLNESNQQLCFFTKRAFKKGEAIASFDAGSISSSPSYLTVQVGTNKHIMLQPSFLQYINHSCEPNCFFDTTTKKVLALADIANGEELGFFYPSSEWEMQQPFQCFCGTPSCIGEIKGAAFLNREQVAHYRFTDYISQRLTRKARKKVA